MNLDEFKTLEQLAASIKTLDMVTALPWQTYGDTSTIVGWSSYTTKVINYLKIIGVLVFVQYQIAGTSGGVDGTVATFTLPFNQANLRLDSPVRAQDNGGTVVWGVGVLPASSNIFSCYSTANGAGWTASGAKQVQGQFWYIS